MENPFASFDIFQNKAGHQLSVFSGVPGANTPAEVLPYGIPINDTNDLAGELGRRG